MALAIRFDHLIKSGQVTDQADLARLGHVTRARVTQIMNLLNLAPDIQEAILFLPRTLQGHDPIREHMLRPIVAVLDWRKQRVMWKQLLAESTGT
jgi:lipoate-protein ligase A